MPVQSCTENSRPGYRWGQSGKCYTYKPGDKVGQASAKLRASKQGVAIKARTAGLN